MSNNKPSTYILYKEGYDCRRIIADYCQEKENAYVFYLMDRIVGSFPKDYVMIKE